MMGKYELYKDRKGEHRFRLKANSGRTILVSEGYSSRSACENGIASVRKNSGDATQYERKEARNGKHYFVLKSKNHRTIGQGEMYDTEASMEDGIQSVMRSGPSTTVDEHLS